jgi:hypothetical protein
VAISIGSLRTVDNDKPPIGLIYGTKGVGKTALAASFPGSVYLRVGDGETLPSGIKLPGWDINSYADLVDALGALASEEHEFQTAILDSTTALEVIAAQETCARNKWNTLEDPGYGKGFVANASTWLEIFDGLSTIRNQRGMAILLIGHCEIFRFESPISDPYSKYQVDLHKSVRPIVEANTDMILFVNHRVSLKKADAGFGKVSVHGEGSGQRIIYTEERPGFIAKNRFDMDAEIPFKKGEGYKALAKFLPGAAQ